MAQRFSLANDQYGGDRLPAEDEFTSTLVAVDAQTGEVEWKFTTVIHDLWDYDLGAQPALIDFPTPDGVRQAVVQATKYGQVFIFDRATGEPLTPVEERPVPQGAIDGDWTSEVQPFSPGMPDFGSLPGQPERGPVATQGGVTFIGAAMDDYLRGFDSANGEMLWEVRLPAGGQANPMTYMHEGRQYVVIAAGGSFQAETTLGDSVIAYALPEQYPPAYMN